MPKREIRQSDVCVARREETDFAECAVLFGLIQGMRNPFARGTILQSRGIGGSLAPV